MANVFDYIKWRGDLSFTQDPPNAVDALIFSGLSYIPYIGRPTDRPEVPVTMRDAAEDFFADEDSESRVRSKNDAELLRAAACSRRFGGCRVVRYRNQFVPERETQFAAVTFLLPDGSTVLAFRGTDSSLVGWKEDFNMTFQQTIPAQLLAQAYVREIAADYSGTLRLCGHSKGGNLAVFSAARSSPMVQERIAEVYNNDGPGFTDYLMGDPGYLAMVPRIKTYVPQSSVIGMLLEHAEPYTVIKSNQVSVLQHDLYTWEVMGADFVPMQSITADSRFLNQTIKAWIADMDTQERNRLVDTMFGLLGTGEIEKALDIFHPRNIRTYIKTLGNDPDTRRILSAEFQNLMEAVKKTRSQLVEAKSLDAPEGKS